MATNDPDKTDNQQRSSVAVWLSVALVLLSMLYVLSTGPAAWLSANGCLSPKVYVAFYAPLDMTHSLCPTLGDAIGYYERQWLRLPALPSGPPPEIQQDSQLPAVRKTP